MMDRKSWILVLAASLALPAGCKKEELRAKDARIAELEANGQEIGASLEQCKKDRENLDTLVKGYTGEINAMEAALAEAAAREARAAKRLAEYNCRSADLLDSPLFQMVERRFTQLELKSITRLYQARSRSR